MGDFEIFKEVRARTKVYISITDNKTFGLPRTFMDKFGVTKEHKAILIYSKSKNKIALHFTLEGNIDFGLAVRETSPKYGATIGARSFFDIKEIDAAKYSGRYSDFEVCKLSDLGINNEGDAYVITLRERRKESTSNNSTELGSTNTENINNELEGMSF